MAGRTSKNRQIEDGKKLRCNVTQAEEMEPQDRLRQLAQEVIAEISELDPSRSKELLGAFVSELFISVAEQERRETRHQKQTKGIAAAKEQGVQFGRQRLPLPNRFENVAEMWEEGTISASCAAKELGMSRDTFLRRAKEYCIAK